MTKVSFREKRKWGFSDGSSLVNADIQDPAFLKRLEERSWVYKGDVLHVVLRTEQNVSDTGKFRTENVIERVIRYLPGGLAQFPLFV